MEFLRWHYTGGYSYYIQSWMASFDWIINYFSLEVLVGSIFAPYKRLVVVDKSPGFNIARYFEVLSFNLISRGIGAVVRLTLLFVGLVLIVIAFFAGVLGLILWLIFPPLGYFAYDRHNRSVKKVVARIVEKIKQDKSNVVKEILSGSPGRFFLAHTGLEVGELQSSAKHLNKLRFDKEFKTYSELIGQLVNKKVWSKDFLRKKGLKPEDLVLAANWWDKKRKKETALEQQNFTRPGIGLELLFGYTPTLNQFSIDLSTPLSYSHRLIGREPVVNQMERVLTGGNSIVLIGQPGVGKKTVVLEFAHRASHGQLGRELAFRRILEFDFNFLLSESVDLNKKKAKLSLALAEAAAAGNIILMFRDIQRLTHPDVEGYDFTDVFEEYMEQRELKIIAVSTPRDYERFIAPNMRLRKFLKKIEVTPPNKEEALEILIEAADNWESKKNYTIPVPTLRKILEESDRYITEVPFPEKALELLDALIMYKDQKGGDTIEIDDANAILAEKTGVSFTRLTKTEKTRLQNLEDIIHKRLVDQDAAVELISKTLRAKTVGVIKEDRPVGSFLFLGPTGVGKTETAKVLARVYFGSEDNIIRFDMAEYAGSEGLERLIGSVSKNQPGALTTAIKNHPSSLLLLDEFEKVSKDILNLFLTLLDEGRMTDAFGKKITARHLFIIATSNAGAEYIRKLVGSGISGEELQTKVVNYVLEKDIFTPEFLNRFDGVVVYAPLNEGDLVKIAKLLLAELGATLRQKGVHLRVTEPAAKKLASDGYDPAFGARPMRRIIDISIGDMLGSAILSEELKEGDVIEIVPLSAKEKFDFKKVGEK